MQKDFIADDLFNTLEIIWLWLNSLWSFQILFSVKWCKNSKKIMFQCHFFRENHHSKIYLSSTENLSVKNMRNLMYCIYLQEAQTSSLTEDLIEEKSCGQ